jgi:O-methyltransferase
VRDLLPKDHNAAFWGDRLLSLDKSAGFLTEPRFAAALPAIRGSHAYDQYDSPHSIAWRLHTLVWAAHQACGLAAGDLVECGVFKGDIAWVVTAVLGEKLRGRSFYLYDSFAGFAPDLAKPEDYPDNPGFIDFANRFYQERGLYDAVVARFAAMPNVRVTRGFLPQVLSTLCPDKIGFLHIDLNSPQAEIGCLERLFDRAVTGGVIVFDDYGWHAFRVQKAAEDAFFAARGYSLLELPTGQGLVIKR